MHELAVCAGSGESKHPLRVLSLCSGIGGIDLGLQRAGYRTVCYVERDPYRVAVLTARIRDGWLDDAPIWDDVTTFDGRCWCGCVDILTGGLPCQPFSLAGNRRGEQDERYLWPAISRIIGETRPNYVLLENVPGVLVGIDGRPAPLSTVLADLAALRYDVEWASLPACAFGFPHRRERIFVIAYPGQKRWQRLSCLDLPARLQAHYSRTRSVSNPLDSVLALIPQVEQRMGEPSVFGSGDGLSSQVERLAAVGEAVVPQLAEYLGLCLRAWIARQQQESLA